MDNFINQHKYIYKDKNETNGELVLNDEYKKEQYKHGQYFEEQTNNITGDTEQIQIHYGDKGDIIIDVK